MKWILIRKDVTVRPTEGVYSDWKCILSEEGKNQCVYCAISEAMFGGFRNFHVEHFRPKSRFKGLTNEFDNLYYVCSICNTFKGSDWPDGLPDRDEELDIETAVYPPPRVHDLGDLITIGKDGVLTGVCKSGAYLVERCYLNRPQLIRARRMTWVRDEVMAALSELTGAMLNTRIEPELSSRVSSAINRAVELLCSFSTLPPYKPSEVSRVVK